MSDKVNTLNALRLASLRSKGYTAEQIAALAETLQSILEDINTSLEECENHVQSPHAPATAEENDIVAIKRNGIVVAPTDKVVDILVPTKVSELTNDSQFATVQQVQSEVAGSGHLSSEVVNTLPSPQEAQPNTIYFVLQNNAGAGNQYIEYMLINGALEAIGYGNADLSGYVTEDYVAKADICSGMSAQKSGRLQMEQQGISCLFGVLRRTYSTRWRRFRMTLHPTSNY